MTLLLPSMLPTLLIISSLLLPSTSLYNTRTTLTNHLPVHTWCNTNKAQAVYTLTTTANRHDILLITADAEVTTELPYNVVLCSYIAVNGEITSAVNGCNINRSRHHEPIHKRDYYRVQEDAQYTISLMLYCASSDAREGDTIKVEGYDPKNNTYYGKLSVIILKGVTE